MTPITNNFNFLNTHELGPVASTISNMARSGNQIFLFGNFTNIGPNQGSGVLVDSISKTALGSRAWKINGYVRASVPDGQGGFYIGGDFTQIGDIPRNHLAQIDAAGRPTVWDPNVDQPIYALYKRNDTLFIGGIFTAVAHQTRRTLAAWSLSGDTLLPYQIPVDSTNYSAAVYAFKPLGNDKLFIGGYFTFGLDGAFDFRNIREYDIGKMSFTTWAPMYDVGSVTTIDLSQDGKTVFYTGGDTHRVYADDVSSGNGGFSYRLHLFAPRARDRGAYLFKNGGIEPLYRRNFRSCYRCGWEHSGQEWGMLDKHFFRYIAKFQFESQ